MRRYTSEMKEAMVAKLCGPGAPTYSQLAAESGIGLSTLHKWVASMGGERSSANHKRRLQDWDPVQKLKAVFDSQGLSETELGEFVRRSGVHTPTLNEWKAEAIADAVEKKTRGRPRLDPEVVECRQKIIQLERELRRKDKALAEAAAIIVLQKKMKEYWASQEAGE